MIHYTGSILLIYLVLSSINSYLRPKDRNVGHKEIKRFILKSLPNSIYFENKYRRLITCLLSSEFLY